MIKEKKVKRVMKRLYCDKCGTEMRRLWYVHTSWTEQYPYECPQCGYQETASEIYPCIEYVEVEEEQP